MTGLENLKTKFDLEDLGTDFRIIVRVRARVCVLTPLSIQITIFLRGCGMKFRRGSLAARLAIHSLAYQRSEERRTRCRMRERERERDLETALSRYKVVLEVFLYRPTLVCQYSARPLSPLIPESMLSSTTLVASLAAAAIFPHRPAEHLLPHLPPTSLSLSLSPAYSASHGVVCLHTERI